MKRTLIIVELSLICCCVPCYSAQQLTIGIEESVLATPEKVLILDTLRNLKNGLKDQIAVKELHGNDLRKAILNNQVQIFISTSSFFSSMGRTGAKDLATAISERSYDPDHGKSIAILVRMNDKGMVDLQGLKNRSISFNSSYGLEPLHIFSGELLKKELNPKKILSSVRVFSGSLSDQLSELRKGIVDAVILPSCELEENSGTQNLNSFDLRVLEPKLHSGFRCVHSGSAYPNITIATLPAISARMSRDILKILLEMEPSEKGMYWGTATDFESVDGLLRSLGIDAHAEERKWTFKRVLNEYRYAFLGILLLLIGLFAHSVRTESLVLRRTKQLSNSLKAQENLRHKVAESQEKLSTLQRLGALNQISSLFAHELRQPLNVIRCYSFSLKKLIEKNREFTDQQKFLTGLSEITEQALRADSIIQKVRDYLKNTARHPVSLNFYETLVRVRDNFLAAHEDCRFILEGSEDALVYGDKLEFELILTNLIKNSYEASSGLDERKVFISWREENLSLMIEIWDNGPELSNESLHSLSENFKSTKPHGLGLGLSIVSIFIEKNNGTISYWKSSLGGLLVKINLPQEPKQYERKQ